MQTAFSTKITCKWQIQPSEAPADPSHPGFAKKANKKAKQKVVLENDTVLYFFLYIIFTAILLKQPQERGKKAICVNINNDFAVSLSSRSSQYLNYCTIRCTITNAAPAVRAEIILGWQNKS